MLKDFDELKELERKGYTIQEQWEFLQTSPELIHKLSGQPRKIIQIDPQWAEKLKLLDALAVIQEDTKNFAVCCEALEQLRKLGKISKEAIPFVIQILSQKDKDIVHLSALEFLHQMEEEAKPAIPILLKFLKHPWPVLRQKAVAVLGQMGKEAKEAKPILRDACKSDDVLIRIYAAEALCKMNVSFASSLETILEPLQFGNIPPYIRFAAVNALGKIGPKANIALPVLNTLLEVDTDPQVVLKTAKVWAQFGGPIDEAFPLLMEALEEDWDPFHDWRAEAAEILGLFGSKAKMAIDKLSELKDNPDQKIRKKVRLALKKIKVNSDIL